MNPFSKLKVAIDRYLDQKIELRIEQKLSEHREFLREENSQSTSQKQSIHDKSIHDKCTLGENSVIYNPEIILSQDKDVRSICIGSHTHVRGDLMTFPGGKIEIGDFCYVGEGTRIWSDTLIRIEDRVLIAHNVNIFDNQTHPLDPIKRHQQFVDIIQKGFPKDIDLGGKPVVIESDVWIACGVIILRGVHIGRAAVIAAGSVVTKDVPSGAVVAGNPARVVRKIEHLD